MSDHISDDFLNEYLDGVLSASQTAKVETHLAACAVCAAHAQSLRALFTTLDDLPDLPLEKDFSKAVVRAVQPEIFLPRPWKWAVWGQIALTALLFALSLPTLLQTDWLVTLTESPGFPQPLSELSLYFDQLSQAINQPLTQWLERLVTLQTPTLPFSISVLIPVLLVTSLLWLVGNGLLLKNNHNTRSN